jgi:hypothetical protein
MLTIAAIAGLAWYGYSKYQAQSHPPSMDLSKVERERGFQCDGRTRCNQMTSCAEATYFIQHCPGAKMDGDNDGIPCEDQWCAR